jgi:hypothetical protein
MVRSRFVANVTSANGGATAAMNAAPFDVVDSVFEQNTASDALFGGALAAASVNVLRTRFTGIRGGSGGAIHASGASIVDSELCDNAAVSEAGAIRVGNAGLSISGSTLCSNAVTTSDTSFGGGGAIAVAGSGPLLIDRSSSDANTALRGGAISHMSSGSLTIHGATIVAPAFAPVGAAGTALRLGSTIPVSLRELRNTLVRGSCRFASAEDRWDAVYGSIDSSGNTCRFGSAGAIGAI